MGRFVAARNKSRHPALAVVAYGGYSLGSSVYAAKDKTIREHRESLLKANIIDGDRWRGYEILNAHRWAQYWKEQMGL